MKNETARREIESLDYYLQNHTNDYSEESHMAMMMAIKALEQQPCEDCISRVYIEPIVEELENICINGDEHILSLLSDIKNAPPVTPQRPKGKWMECGGDEPWLKGYCCSLCNFTTTQKYDYCTCGAEMSGGEEDEDSD